MEYCRRAAITEFSFTKEFCDYPHSITELIHTVCELISGLEGGEYFITTNSNYPKTSYSLSFYFYNVDDMILAKLSI